MYSHREKKFKIIHLGRMGRGALSFKMIYLRKTAMAGAQSPLLHCMLRCLVGIMLRQFTLKLAVRRIHDELPFFGVIEGNRPKSPTAKQCLFNTFTFPVSPNCITDIQITDLAGGRYPDHWLYSLWVVLNDCVLRKISTKNTRPSLH
jgi:hypothetical protein